MKITKNLLRAALAVAKDQSRPILTRMNITHKDGVTVAACTDSFRLLEVTEKLSQSQDEAALISTEELKIAKARLSLVKADTSKFPTSEYEPVSVDVEPVENGGKFPNYEVITRRNRPEGERGQCVRVNAEMLKGMLDAFIDKSGGVNTVDIYIKGEVDAIEFVGERRSYSVYGLLMPVRKN